jgi:endonuclease/exonuclease/phosphatase (EEP) superfamily protein YafD
LHMSNSTQQLKRPFWLWLGLRELLIAGAVAYSLALALFSLAWLFGLGPQRWQWWLQIANIVALAAFAPGVALIPPAIGMRSWRMRGAAMLTAGLFVAQYGAALLPRLPAPQTAQGIRVATFNHLVGNPNTEPIIAAIRAQRADIVALQELSWPVARAAEHELDALYPYQYLLPGSGHYGLGILSRFPLRNPERTFGLGFNGQRVEIDAPGGTLTFFNIHLPAPIVEIFYRRDWGGFPTIVNYLPGRRTDELAALLSAIDAEHGTLIVAGDFNLADRERQYAAFAARMQDAFRNGAWGLGYTYPNGRTVRGVTLPFPIARIDYVWVRGLATAGAWTDCRRTGSDHCVVGAELVPASDASAAATKGGDSHAWPWR